MKIISCIFCLFVIGCSLFAAPRLALVGDRELTGLVAAAVQDEFELMERGELDRILAEHRLSAVDISGERLTKLFTHVDLFAVVYSVGGSRNETPSSVSIFNARNGCRLADTALPSGYDEAAVGVVSALRIAASRQTASIPVALTAVRDSGIPVRFRPELEALTARLELTLGRSGGLQLLERARLGMVNEERELTGEADQLLPAARLIRLEFLPGAAVGAVDLTVRITDSAGKVLTTFTVRECFASPRREEELMEKIGVALRLPASSATVNPVAEAERFYAEYGNLMRRQEKAAALRKIEAACALDPARETYARVRLALQAELLETFPHEQRAAEAGKLLDRMERFRQAFPDSRTDFFSSGGFSRAFRYLRDRYRKPEKAEVDAAAVVLERLRRLCLDEISRSKWGGFDLSDGIGSVAEFKRYQRALQHSAGRREVYADRASYYRGHLEQIRLELEAAHDLAGRVPEPEKLKIQITDPNLGFSAASTEWLVRESERLYGMASPLIDLALAHPVAAIRRRGMDWELLRETYASKLDPEAFRRNYHAYCRRILDAGGRFVQPPAWHGLYGAPELKTLAGEIGAEYFDFRPEARFERLCARIRDEEEPERKAGLIRELAPELRKFRSYMLLHHRGKENAYALDLRDRAAAGELPAQLAMQALSGGTEISLLHLFEKPERILDAVDSGGSIFLLILRQGNIAEVARLSADGGEMKTVCRFPIPGPVSEAAGLPEGREFSVSGRYAVWGLGELLLLIDLEAGTVRPIGDLPEKKVTACTVMNGRIYAFFCPNAHKTLLMSCDLEGGDRRLLISNVREEKRNWFDRQTEFRVESVWPDPERDRLLVNATWGLWELKPVSMEHRRICELTNLPSRVQMVGRSLYVSAFDNEFYRYDLDFDHLEHFLSVRIDGRESKSAKYTVQVANTGFESPFYFAGDRIWFGGFCSMKSLKLPDVEHSTLVYAPVPRSSESMAVFPYPDGRSVLFAGWRSVVKVTPEMVPEEGK